MVVVNSFFAEQAEQAYQADEALQAEREIKRPRRLLLQVDGASVNKNSLVFGFLAQYVMFGVFESVEVRFLLEHHAHDVYDAFHAIHARSIRGPFVAESLNTTGWAG